MTGCNGRLLPKRNREPEMAKRTQNIIIVLLVTALLIGLAWPMLREAQFQKRIEEDHTLLVARPSRHVAADYQVRDPLNYVSPAGIFYGKDLSGKFASRIEHVMAHTAADDSKPQHSVFAVTKREDVLRLLDEAWKRRGPPKREGSAYGRDVYDIPMKRVVGTQGERRIRIITEADQPSIITAYPVRQ